MQQKSAAKKHSTKAQDKKIADHFSGPETLVSDQTDDLQQLRKLTGEISSRKIAGIFIAVVLLWTVVVGVIMNWVVEKRTADYLVGEQESISRRLAAPAGNSSSR